MLKKKATETADSEKSEWFFWFRKHNFKNQAIRASWEKASFLTVEDEEKNTFLWTIVVPEAILPTN